MTAAIIPFPSRADAPGAKAGGRAIFTTWPQHLEALGAKTIGPFTSCGWCVAGTWVRYGTTALCLGCAEVAQRLEAASPDVDTTGAVYDRVRAALAEAAS